MANISVEDVIKLSGKIYKAQHDMRKILQALIKDGKLPGESATFLPERATLDRA